MVPLVAESPPVVQLVGGDFGFFVCEFGRVVPYETDDFGVAHWGFVPVMCVHVVDQAVEVVGGHSRLLLLTTQLDRPFERPSQPQPLSCLHVYIRLRAGGGGYRLTRAMGRSVSSLKQQRPASLRPCLIDGTRLARPRYTVRPYGACPSRTEAGRLLDRWARPLARDGAGLPRCRGALGSYGVRTSSAANGVNPLHCGWGTVTEVSNEQEVR